MTAKKTALEYPVYLFKEGTNFELYKMMSPRSSTCRGKTSWTLRVYAPHAKSVSVVGDFNGWDTAKNPMKGEESGIWEVKIPNLKTFDNYKFAVVGQNGKLRMKSDPFAVHTETPPSNASKLYELKDYKWSDGEYCKARGNADKYKTPINIYEVHLGSWKRHEDGSFLTYRELADELVPYVKEMGYTHIEVLPVTEYPLEASWGYQTGFLFAPTSRYGLPEDFMYFVDKAHQAGLGVLLDIVLSHFPKDEFGLYEFDGAPLYEYEDKTKQEHKGWGTRVYDFGKGIVKSLLISAACFWLENYHIDGLRLDAVASMLYLDYDRKGGEWKPNRFGGNYNLEAIEFLKLLNKTVLTKFPYAITVAEESTAFPMVTMPPDVGGLGFNYKWNMGWMNDTLSYIKTDALFRKGCHNKMTFSLTYAFSENYILPFSHDEVVHGKCSLIGKIPGDYDDKFRGLKTLFAYQIAHPGKKLNFMGSEFAQFIEWDFAKGLDWLLLDYDKHRAMQSYVKALNKLYASTPALYERDCRYDGFKWLVVDDNAQSVFAFYRESEKGKRIVCIMNFTPVIRENYMIGVPDCGTYKVVLNSNDKSFGEETSIKSRYKTLKKPNHGQNQSIKINIEGNSALFLVCEEPTIKK